jgi:hypothetical protein
LHEAPAELLSKRLEAAVVGRDASGSKYRDAHDVEMVTAGRHRVQLPSLLSESGAANGWGSGSLCDCATRECERYSSPGPRDERAH